MRNIFASCSTTVTVLFPMQPMEERGKRMMKGQADQVETCAGKAEDGEV